MYYDRWTWPELKRELELRGFNPDLVSFKVLETVVRAPNVLEAAECIVRGEPYRTPEEGDDE